VDAEPRLSIESFESLVVYGHLYRHLLELPSVLERESQYLSTIKEGEKKLISQAHHQQSSFYHTFSK
jgi:hypothetical protein